MARERPTISGPHTPGHSTDNMTERAKRAMTSDACRLTDQALRYGVPQRDLSVYRLILHVKISARTMHAVSLYILPCFSIL